MDGGSDSSLRAYGLVVVASLTYTLLMFTWFSVPAYLTAIGGDLGLTDTQAGIVVGAIPAVYIPLSLLSGLVVDRFGPGRSLAIGSVVFGSAQALRSLATGFPSLLAATLLLGVGATAITFGLPKLVSTLFPTDRTGFPSSVYLIGASAGTATVFGLGRPIIGPLLGGWRPLFRWSGAVAVAYGLCWYLLARRADIDDRVGEANEPLSLGAIRRDLRHVLTHRDLQLLVVVGAMYLTLNHGLQGWLPAMLEARGLGSDLAGGATGAFAVVFALGVFTVPLLADRLANRRLVLVGCGLAIAAGIGGILLGGTGPLLAAGIAATGLSVGGLSPLVRAMPPELDGVGPRLTGTAVGFVFAVGELGGFFGPVLVGTLRDATGSFQPGLAVLGIGGLVVAAAGLQLYRA